MLAVKKIGGIARVKRAGLETLKGRKDGARPFPPVADQVVHAESAGAAGMCADRSGIPMAKIKIAMRFGGRSVAPGIAAFLGSLGSAVGGPVKLFFAGQTPAQPFGVRRGLRVANVHRPFHGQRNLAEHGPIGPEVAFAEPEGGLRNVIFFLPGPTFGSPK